MHKKGNRKTRPSYGRFTLQTIIAVKPIKVGSEHKNMARGVAADMKIKNLDSNTCRAMQTNSPW